MSESVYRCFAKINLHLEVGGRRSDGYHELRTIFQTIDLHDLLGVEPGGVGVRLAVEGREVPTGDDNLVVQAAKRFLDRWSPGTGVRLWLDKRIPVGGGLGGGSSDAASLLLALQSRLGDPASAGELRSLARELGADVPYFLLGGTALGVGRGDELTPMTELSPTTLWLVTPQIEISTADVFARHAERASGSSTLTGRDPTSSILAASQARGGGGLRLEDVAGINDLEPIVFERFPEVRRLYNLLLEAGAAPVRLSGTGASLFARFKTTEAVEGLKGALPPCTGCVRVRTLTRDELAAVRVVGEER